MVSFCDKQHKTKSNRLKDISFTPKASIVNMDATFVRHFSGKSYGQ